MLTDAEEQELLTLLDAEAQASGILTLASCFPASGPYARHLYPKHLEFFRAGAHARERLALMGNRTGKTLMACFELTCHLLGEYLSWWEGRRFLTPIRAWAVGETAQTTRDILQATLLGPPGQWGSAFVPADRIRHINRSPGNLADAVEQVQVLHVSGAASVLGFKSYVQQRESFQGTAQQVILLDEEAPIDIRTECLLRTMTVDGIVMHTFTPLQGLSETVLQFLPDGQLPDGEQTGERYVVNASWDDVPHLSEAQKAEYRRSVPAYQLDARTRGLPVLGAGAIYPVPEEDYLVDDMEIPKHWPRAYALDVGWNMTAAVWGAFDRETDKWVLYYEYYRGQAEPSVHATAIKAPGEWIPGVIDPAARGRAQRDGSQLIEDYRNLGLHLTEADNAVEAGIYQVWERLSTGRLKIAKSLGNLRRELRLYHRDERGRIVKANDHGVDAMRYLMLSGEQVARVGAAPALALYTPGMPQTPPWARQAYTRGQR